MIDHSAGSPKDLRYWQNKLFATAIFYAIPISLFSLIPSIILELREGHTFVTIFNFCALATVVAVSLHKKVRVENKKIFVAISVAVYAIIMMAFMGSFTLGAIYLFPLSIFVALQFEDHIAYRVVALNGAIFAFFAFDLWLRPVYLPVLFHNTSLNHWLIYSVNFMFMDIVVVILIRRLLSGMDRTLAKEVLLVEELAKKLREIEVSNELLNGSVMQYRTLFFQSPIPKWIFDLESLEILQVNEAAVKNYGYTEQEFLSMRVQDIHPDNQIPNILQGDQGQDHQVPLVTTHKRKGGDELDVAVRHNLIFFEGRNACLVVASDISEQLRYTRNIELKNQRLKEVAHMQSHVMRVPVANVIGLADLILQSSQPGDDKELFEYLARSARQLDEVVNQVVKQAEDLILTG